MIHLQRPRVSDTEHPQNPAMSKSSEATPPVAKHRQHNVWQQYLLPWTDELGRIHCLKKGRLIHTGTAVLGNQTDLYEPPPLTEADMKFLRDLSALDKAHPLVRARHEDLFQQLLAPSLFAERNRASLNNLPQIDELLDIDFRM